MRRYLVFFMILLFPVIAPAAGWDDLGVKVVTSGSSDEKGSTRYTLNDAGGRSFEVNYPETPDQIRMKRVVELKDTIYAWRGITARRIEFYFSGEGIYLNLHLKSIKYKDKDLMPYLPAGLAFQDRKEGLYYRFRIVVSGTSHMLEGIYSDEESLLQRIYGFIYEEEVKEEAAKLKENNTQLLSLRAEGYYLLPTGKLAEVFDAGYGALAGISLHNAGISLNDKTLFHLDFTFLTGYWSYSTKSGISDEYSCDVQSAYIIPLIVNVKYLFRPFTDFYIAPLCGAGLNYASIDYIEPVSGSSGKPEKIKAIAPSLSAGFETGYSIIKNRVSVFAGAEYMGIFEREMTATSWVFYAGVEYTFMVLGN